MFKFVADKIILFNETKLPWSHINVSDFKNILEYNNISFIPLSEKKILELNYNEDDEVCISEIYKSIKLIDVCLYNICNELEIFKNELCFDRHKKVLNKWFYLAKRTIDYLESIFNNNYIEGVIVFHGHLLFDACLLSISKLRKVKFITIEITSNVNKLVWDDLSGFVVTYNLAKNYFYKHYLEQNYEVVSNYCNNYLNQINLFKSIEHLSSSETKKNTLKNKKPYLLYISQVYNDASQLFSLQTPIENPIEIIKEVGTIAKDLGFEFVVKLHPKEFKGVNPVTLKEYNNPTSNRLNCLENQQHVFVDSENRYNTYELIKSASVVITVNSQAGLEACLLNKPVFTYFKGFYSGIGFTYDYDNLIDLRLKLEHVLSAKISSNKDSKTAEIFFYTFNEIYCIARNELALFNKLSEVFDLRICEICKQYKFLKNYLSKAKKSIYKVRRMLKFKR